MKQLFSALSRNLTLKKLDFPDYVQGMQHQTRCCLFTLLAGSVTLSIPTIESYLGENVTWCECDNVREISYFANLNSICQELKAGK